MSDQIRGTVASSNSDASLNLLQMCVGIHGRPFHARDASALSFLQDIDTEQRVMAMGGRYFLVPPTLDANDMSALRLTADGKLMVDATVTVIPTGGFTSKFYWEGIVGQGVTAAAFSGVGLDDATSGGTFGGVTATFYVVRIHTAAATDTFEWSDDNGATWDDNGGVGYNITGAAQALSDGVTITFGAVTGHTVGENWSFMATANIDTINFGFLAQEVIIYNDGTDDLHFEYGAAAVAGTYGLPGVSTRLFGGEALADDFQSTNIHFAVVAGDSTTVRIVARGI